MRTAWTAIALTQRTVGLEVAPPSEFHGHNFIKVRNPTDAMQWEKTVHAYICAEVLPFAHIPSSEKSFEYVILQNTVCLLHTAALGPTHRHRPRCCSANVLVTA